MGTFVPWSDEESEELKRRHAAGESLTSIAKTMVRSQQTIGAKAKKLGLSFDRAPMKAALEAARIDHSARRRSIADRLYKQVEDILDSMEDVGTRGSTKRFVTTQKLMGGEDVRATLDYIPTQDRMNLTRSMGTLLTSVTNLEKVDADGGMDLARSMLGKILLAIQVSVQGKELLNPTAGVAGTDASEVSR